jgi:hypothetical protein
LTFYYYAHTGHRIDLDGVRRAAALLPHLENQGITTKLLVNDFRAALVAKEYGIEGAVSVESIHDIDLVLDIGDSLFIDSSEELPRHFENFCRDYKKVFRLARDCDDRAQSQEEVLSPWDESMRAIFIDDIYLDDSDKKNGMVLFYGDSDPKKELLGMASQLKDRNINLLLGEYFYLGYEDELGEYFTQMYEPEEYKEIISHSKDVITFSLQCAMEAKSAGANVVYIEKEKLNECTINVLEWFQITYLKKNDFQIDKFILKNSSKRLTKNPLKDNKIDFYIANKINS